MKSHPYFGQTAVLATKHSKGKVIAPPFLETLGMNVIEVAVDTDLLGTFSGEIERVGSPREVAIHKARLGMQASGRKFGIASEGSIGVDPYIPFINSDFEVIVFIDDILGIEVVENFRSAEINAHTITVEGLTDLSEFLKKADFPQHKLIVRSNDQPVSYCVKGIDKKSELEESIAIGLKEFSHLIIESDLRAHCSPSRQLNIEAAARKLAERLLALCPTCSTPGWGVIGFTKGLPCELCGEIAHEAPAAEILGCTKCTHQTAGKVLAEKLDPARCNLCNP